jgi:signal transduction histidine kinase
VVLTSDDDAALSVQALREGAEDYLLKGAFGSDVLMRALRYAHERSELRRKLAHADRLAAVGRLAAGVAHEVGNPLAAIGNYVEVLRRRGADPDLVVAVERETARIDAIVRSLLDYARPREGHREPVDLGRVAADVVALLDAQGVLRGIAVRTDVEPDVPPVPGDRSALEQVFVNLVLNAVDAAGAGGAVRLRVAAAADRARTVAATVEDSGSGIPAELRERIFDPFFTTKAPGRGTGLGLAIVQRIVHDHGGRVNVDASPLGGASFTVALPAGAA